MVAAQEIRRSKWQHSNIELSPYDFSLHTNGSLAFQSIVLDDTYNAILARS